MMLNRINELLQTAQASNEIEALMLDAELSQEEAALVTGGASYGGYVPAPGSETWEFAYWYYFLK